VKYFFWQNNGDKTVGCQKKYISHTLQRQQNDKKTRQKTLPDQSIQANREARKK